jgi:hypothetical protein
MMMENTIDYPLFRHYRSNYDFCAMACTEKLAENRFSVTAFFVFHELNHKTGPAKQRKW